MLRFYALDTTGNLAQTKTEEYDIDIERKNPCGKEMVWVQTGVEGYCIDRYEWPNRKKTLPQAFVTLYGAVDSCLSVGKRLCTSQEWYFACSGSMNRAYSYGDIYEYRACNTRTKTVAHSGTFPECRSYNGAMDMNGNLREWTYTKAPENSRFYKVQGGFWESHSNSACDEYQYSFYPQNSHLSVGFRCCKSIRE
jgi:formylglycine-generating enzyme required for sulfatase activity